MERPEEILYEMQLVESIRFTDTFAEHDTLTVDEKLVADPMKFFKLGLYLVGSNFLKIPYE